ncbi:MAG: hypothetical protein AAF141_07960 [Pseudomonadota bacterium]
MAALVHMVDMEKAEKVVASLTAKLPLPALDALGGSMGRFASRKTRRARRDDMDVVLPHLLPHLSRRDIERLIDRNWSYVGRTMLRIGNLPRVVRQVPVEVHGLESVKQMAQANEPHIFAFVHLGMWELLAVQTAQFDRLPLIIYQAPLSKARTEIALRTRSEAYLERYKQFHEITSEREAEDKRAYVRSMMLEGKQRATAQVLKGLKEGKSAWFATDECVDGHVHGPWFGKTDARSGNLSVIARLAEKTGAKIVPCWCVAQGHNKSESYGLNYGAPISAAGSVEETMDAITAVLQPQVTAHYEQWFMLHELRPKDFSLTPS